MANETQAAQTEPTAGSTPSVSSLGGSGIAGLFGTILTNMVNAGLTMYTNIQNREQFLENREYNSPENTMKRMVAAGINPNAAAQGISGAPAASQSQPIPMQTPQFSASPFIESAKMMQNEELIRSEVEKNRANTAGQLIENVYKPAILDLTLQQFEDQHNLDSEALDFARKNNQIILELNREQVNQLKANIREIDESIENLRKQRDVMTKEIEKMGSEISLNRIRELEAANNIRLIDANVDVANAQKSLMDKDALIKSVEAHYAQQDQLLYDSVGFTPSQKQTYEQYLAIKHSKGDAAADRFLNGVENVTSRVEEAVDQVKFHYDTSFAGSIMNLPVRAGNFMMDVIHGKETNANGRSRRKIRMTH